MYVYDVNGDGRNDVITSIKAHGYGLSWFEQDQDGSFAEHVILGKTKAENADGKGFSQIHALEFTDLNGDGLPDIICGKRRWAHGIKGDDEPNAAPVLYWFQLRRQADKSVDWIPHQVDDLSGTGTEVKARDYNGDGKPDILVGNKHGVYVFTHATKSVSAAEYQAAQPKPLSP